MPFLLVFFNKFWAHTGIKRYVTGFITDLLAPILIIISYFCSRNNPKTSTSIVAMYSYTLETSEGFRILFEGFRNVFFLNSSIFTNLIFFGLFYSRYFIFLVSNLYFRLFQYYIYLSSLYFFFSRSNFFRWGGRFPSCLLHYFPEFDSSCYQLICSEGWRPVLVPVSNGLFGGILEFSFFAALPHLWR